MLYTSKVNSQAALGPGRDTDTARAAVVPVTSLRPGTGRVLRGLLVSTRPRQWLKNVVVLAAPAAAGVIGDPAVAVRVVGTALLFSAVSGGLYLLNDVADRQADRAHPAKSRRPVASGVVPVGLATAVGVALVATGLLLSPLVAGWALAAVIGTYAASTLAYSLWLKDEPVIELVIVASGFVLRAIAGGVAAHVPLSHWFLIVTSFGSLFMVVEKRDAERRRLAGSPDGRTGTSPDVAGNRPTPRVAALHVESQPGAVGPGTEARDGGSPSGTPRPGEPAGHTPAVEADLTRAVLRLRGRGHGRIGRAALEGYPADFLPALRSIAAAVTILAYCLWAFERAAALPHAAPFFEASIAPFVIGLLRYWVVAADGRGETPEDVVLGDRRLQLSGLLWAMLFACGTYVG